MASHFVLTQLQGRLDSVQRRLNEAAAVQPAEPGYLYAAGQLLTLRGEKLFLLSLIEQITGMERP